MTTRYGELKKHVGHQMWCHEIENGTIEIKCAQDSEIIETVEKPEAKLRIIRDESPTDPRQDRDNQSTMACWHRRYNLGDEQPKGDPDEWLKEHAPKGSIVLNLYLMDHGGISMSCKPFGDPWDSGQVGYMVMTPDQIRECFGKKRITKQMREKALEGMKLEVAEYDNYLQGNCWGYEFTDENGEEESCWGFIGGDKKELEYMKDSMSKPAQALFDEAWDNRE